jgi:hypothetical protein
MKILLLSHRSEITNCQYELEMNVICISYVLLSLYQLSAQSVSAPGRVWD